MHNMAIASSLLSASADRPRIHPRDLELGYAGPRHSLKDAARVVAALGGVVLYAGLLAVAWQ